MKTSTIRDAIAAITVTVSAILPSYAAEKSVTLTCGGSSWVAVGRGVLDPPPRRVHLNFRNLTLTGKREVV